MKLSQTQIVSLGTIASQKVGDLQKALLQAVTNLNDHNAEAGVSTPVDTAPFVQGLAALPAIEAAVQKHISANLGALPKRPAAAAAPARAGAAAAPAAPGIISKLASAVVSAVTPASTSPTPAVQPPVK